MKKRSEFKRSGYRLVDDVTKLNSDLIKTLKEHRNIDQAWYFNGSPSMDRLLLVNVTNVNFLTQ